MQTNPLITNPFRSYTTTNLALQACWFKSLMAYLLFLIPLVTLSQNKTTRIVPVPPQQPPAFILDGIVVAPSISKDIFKTKSAYPLDSVSITSDSVFTCQNQLAYQGIVKIYTPDTMHLGAKKILVLTHNWLYEHPRTQLKMNGVFSNWDAVTFKLLCGLKPDEVVSAKIVHGVECGWVLELQLQSLETDAMLNRHFNNNQIHELEQVLTFFEEQSF